ncbi:MAG: hypothetical protein VX737_05620 [Pseudomonadota bacterium]|nr:hypothetical protein [Pseudomonadota bacterium]
MKDLITKKGLIRIEYPLGIFCGSFIASMFGVPMASMLALSFLVVTGLVAVHNTLMHLFNRSLEDVTSSVCTKGVRETIEESSLNLSDSLCCEVLNTAKSIDNKEPLNETDCRRMLFQTMRLSTVDGTLFGKGQTPGVVSRSMAFCNRLSESVKTLIFGNNNQGAELL